MILNFEQEFIDDEVMECGKLTALVLGIIFLLIILILSPLMAIGYSFVGVKKIFSLIHSKFEVAPNLQKEKKE